MAFSAKNGRFSARAAHRANDEKTARIRVEAGLNAREPYDIIKGTNGLSLRP
jgi:hypothetical protein